VLVMALTAPDRAISVPSTSKMRDSTARTEELVNFCNAHYLFRNYIAFVIYGHLDLNPVQLGSSAPNPVGVFLQS
jgi:hypothetical protein